MTTQLKTKRLVAPKRMTAEQRYAHVEAQAVHAINGFNPKKPKKPCDCGDQFCYGKVRYTGGSHVGQRNRYAPEYARLDEDGDMPHGNTLDVKVQHLVPCVIVACGKYTMHVRTISGVSTIFERQVGDPRTWDVGTPGWLYSYASDIQVGLYRAFVPVSRKVIKAHAELRSAV